MSVWGWIGCGFFLMAEESPKKSHPLIALLEPMDTFALSDSREETKRRAEALASSERERVDGSVEYADERRVRYYYSGRC